MTFSEKMSNPWDSNQEVVDSISHELNNMYMKTFPGVKYGLPETVAHYAIRLVRDAIAFAWTAGEIRDLYDAELFLNRALSRIQVTTMTGDTTE